MVSFWWMFTAVSFPKCIDWQIGWSQNDGFSIFSLELSRFVGPCSSDGGDGSCLCHALDQMPSTVESPRRSLPDMVTNMISTQQHSHNIYYIMGCQNMLKRPWFSKVLILAVILVAFTDGAVSGQAGSKLVSKWIAFFQKDMPLFLNKLPCHFEIIIPEYFLLSPAIHCTFHQCTLFHCSGLWCHRGVCWSWHFESSVEGGRV